MSNKNLLENIKKLRELTGVGFKDCKIAIDENQGDIEKSVEFLRKKGIAKASKKMSRTASEGLVLAKEDNGKISIIEYFFSLDWPLLYRYAKRGIIIIKKVFLISLVTVATFNVSGLLNC